MKKLLKILVVADWMTLILYFALASTLEKYLPHQLQEYLVWESEQDMDSDSVLWIIVMALFAIWIVSTIGLLFAKSWARWTFVFSVIALEIVSGFAGPTVEHGLLSSITSLGLLIEGVLIYICIFEFRSLVESSNANIQINETSATEN